MKNSTKRNILFVVAIVAALALIVVFGTGPQFGTVVLSSDVVPSTGTVEGEVLAIETTSSNESPRKEAVVKLASGDTVRAYVPPACILFTGQIATLSKYGSETIGIAFYVFKEA